MTIIQLLGDRVAVIPDEKENSKGGLLLTDMVKEKPCTGTVKYVGTETTTGKDLTIKPGDRVLYYRHAGIEIDQDGVKMLVFREPEMVAVIG